jgi:hypothetical protein
VNIKNFLEAIVMIAQMLISALIVGVNAGWQPLPEGGMEYIIQLDPQSLEALKAGQAIQSDVPPRAGEVRTYKIVLGAEKLPQIDPPARATAFPGSFSPESKEKPLTADSAAFVEPAGGAAKSETTPPINSQDKNEESSKPWMPLILVSLVLFASLGGNVYLTWLFADLRRRYQTAILK